MALTIQYKKKSNGVTWKCGHMYKFKYTAYQNDPNPTYLHLYSFSGYHPKSKREWRFHQGINLSYLPRKDRKRFVELWQKQFEKSRNIKITWKVLTRRYPYLRESTRRYFYSPNYYIRNAEEIPVDKWQEEIVKSWHKDFSSAIRKKIASKLKRFFTGSR